MGCDESKQMNTTSVSPLDDSSSSEKHVDSTESSQSKLASQSSSMPFFRKQSSEAKKRLQHQMYLAKESPEPTYDISNCELIEIPTGVYSICKVLQKEAIMAQNNWLTSLKGGGNLKDLAALRILDLHDNDLTSLTEEIGILHCLQVLNLSSNKLKDIPASLSHLSALQTLNLRGNKLKSIPDSICSLKSLRTLDISNNKITALPQKLCQIRTLETLLVDLDHIQYPTSDVCKNGTEAIMRTLCSDCGMEYDPPARHLLDVLEPPRPADLFNSPSGQALSGLVTITDTFMQYEKAKEKKRQERVALERQLSQEQRQQAKLAANAAANKQHLIDYVSMNQVKMQEELHQLTEQKDARRKLLLQSLNQAESAAQHLVKELLSMNEKARRTEELLEQMEHERMDAEEWFKVKQEEISNLRQNEVLVAMERMLQENEAMDGVIGHYLNIKESIMQQAHDESCETDGHLESVLHHHNEDKQGMIDYLLKEDRLQKEAFEALQLQSDARHQRVTGQIELIQHELAQISLLEMEQRQLKVENQQAMLHSHREALTALLIQLIHERGEREEELKQRLREMEEQREDHQTKYWLVQYQRLMDRKPQELIDAESKLEIVVIKLLEKAQASDYIPTFARHRITIETLCHLKDEDLKQLGMHELGLRHSLLMEIKRYNFSCEEEHAASKLKQIDEDWLVKPPSPEGHACPAPSAPEKERSPSAPPLSPTIVARGINSECIVCMDAVSETLFLNCGHVCCCDNCSAAVKECPMCRSEIITKITLRSS